MERQTSIDPADRVGLGFQVRGTQQERHLFLPPRTLFGWLRLEALELQIPGPAGEAPTADAPSELYQRVRTDAVSARLLMEPPDMDAYVAGCGAVLADLGVDELVLRSHDGYVGLSARVREAALVADLSARLYLSAVGDSLRISCGQPRVYGHLDTPAPILVSRLMCAIFRAGADNDAVLRGLGDITVRPLGAALFRTLPAAGWRIPRQKKLRITNISCATAGLELCFGTESNTEVNTGQAAAALGEALDRFAAPEKLLHRGDLEGAMRGYRGELAARGPEQPFLVGRILSIASARREYFIDGLELARQVLGRWPDFAPAHAAIASIAVAQGDAESGAARYRELSQASHTVGDEEGTVRAALAGARLLRQFAPDESTKLYELVLEHRPGHPESAEALADRYRDEERWSDLVRLIRIRLTATNDVQHQARDHARLAEVLMEQLGDSAAALAELQVACRLDNSIPSVHEYKAVVELAQGALREALTSFEVANRIYEQRQDLRGRTRNLIRGGQACLQGDNFSIAERWFRAALELSVGDADAMRGAAQAATGLGRHTDAARLWRELFDSGVEAPAMQASYACELGRSLLLDESAQAHDKNEARAPLGRAVETGGPRTCAEAHALLAILSRDAKDLEGAAGHLKQGIEALSSTAPDQGVLLGDTPGKRQERKAQLSLERGELLVTLNDEAQAMGDFRRAFADALPSTEVRKSAARNLLERTSSTAGELDWVDELSADNNNPDERAYLAIRRAHILDGSADHEAALAAISDALSGDISDTPRRTALQVKAEFLKALGDDAGRADVLAQRAALSGSNAQRATASVESAEGWLAAGQISSSMQASRLALQTLADSESKEAAELRQRALLCLGQCAWKSRQWGDVEEAYRELFSGGETIEDGDSELLLRWGTALEKMGQAAPAAQILEHVVRRLSDDRATAQACRVLGDLYEQLDDIPSAAQALERYAGHKSSELSSAARADAWFRAGSLWRRRSKHSEEAKRCFNAALRITSAHLPALDGLEQIARAEEDHERLAVILGRKVAAFTKHPLRQRGLLVRLAELHETVLEHVDVARETYRRVLKIDPQYRPALRFAAQDARSSGNLPFATEALAQLAGSLPSDVDLPLGLEELEGQRQDALLDLALLVEGTAGEIAAQAMSILQQRAQQNDDDRLWRALEAAYRRKQDAVGLADTLGRRASHLPLELARQADLERLEILTSQLGDRGAAQVALRIALSRHPEDSQLLAWQAQLDNTDQSALRPSLSGSDLLKQLGQEVDTALESDQLDAAITLLHKLAETARELGDVAVEHRSVRNLADLILKTDGDQETASGLYKRALELDPDDLVADALHKKLMGEQPPCAESLSEQALDDGDLDTAYSYLVQAAEADPERLELQRECAELAAARGDAEGCIQWLESVIAAVISTGAKAFRGEKLGDLYLQVADLYYDALRSPDQARRAMLLAARAFGPGMRATSTLKLLASDAETAGKFDEAAAAYEAMGAAISGHTLLAAAKTYQHLEKSDEAIRLLNKAQASQALNEEGKALLETLQRETKSGPKAHVDTEIDQEIEKAQAFQAQGNDAAAQAVFEHAASLAPGDSRPFEALRKIYGELGEHQKLSRVLEQLTTLSTSRKQLGKLFFERAQLARDVFHDDALVYAYLKEAAANDPEQRSYGQALRTIAMARGEWALAAELTYQELALLADIEEQAAVHLELALIYDEKLLDPTQAIANYEQSLRLDPSIPATPRPLARLYELAGRFDDAMNMYEQAADRSPAPLEQARLLRHAAMNAQRADRPERARSLYAAVTATGSTGDSAAAEASIDRIDQDAAEQLTSESQQATGETDSDEKARLHFEIGCAYQHDLEDLNAAVGAYEQALDATPDHAQASDALADIYYQRRDWVRASKLYDNFPAQLSGLPPEIYAMRQGEIAESLGKDQVALESFKTGYKLAPEHLGILSGLSRAAARAGDLDQALSAQRELLAVLPSEAIVDLREARLNLAELYQESGDHLSAIQNYEAALEDQPRSTRILLRLLELYRLQPDHGDAIRVLRKLIDSATTPSARATFMFDLAEIYQETDGRDQLAIDTYLKAIDLAPTHVPTLRRLLEYYWSEGDWAAACEMAVDLSKQDSLLVPDTGLMLLHRAAISAALAQDDALCEAIGSSLGSDSINELARVIIETANAKHAPPSKLLAAAAYRVCTATGDGWERLLALIKQRRPYDQLLLKVLDSAADSQE